MKDCTAGFRPSTTPAPLCRTAQRPERAPRPALSLLDALYRQERDGVLAFFMRRVGPDHASDLTQEVFLRAATSAQLPQLRNPGGFLRRIAQNLAIDFARRRKRRIVTLPLVEGAEGPCSAEQEGGLNAAQSARIVEAVLAGLPDKTARVFAMNRFENKTYRQIHRELGIALPTVDYHMMKALARLRGALDRSPDPPGCGIALDRKK